jgi:2-amino-4-hydroxy-6-hydroxymethyldihydropteridine diphosphokinase
VITAYVALGSNLGDREGNIRKALRLLSQRVRIEKVSSLYETKPEGFLSQPLFLNSVCQISTELDAEELLTLIKGIEKAMGRLPSFPNATRPIDMDILFYGDQIIYLPHLIIPHPRLKERAFVLVPLAEISPHLVHPQSGERVIDLLKKVSQEGVRLWSR